VKARKLVRSNNFTQQTNALDVDKHMCGIFYFNPRFISECISGWHTSRKI
jgi:hypothetical protein